LIDPPLPPPPYHFQTGIMGRNRLLVQGAKLGEMRMAGSKMNVRPKVDIQIQFSKGCPAIYKRGVIETLQEMIVRAEGIIQRFSNVI